MTRKVSKQKLKRLIRVNREYGVGGSGKRTINDIITMISTLTEKHFHSVESKYMISGLLYAVGVKADCISHIAGELQKPDAPKNIVIKRY